MHAAVTAVPGIATSASISQFRLGGLGLGGVGVVGGVDWIRAVDATIWTLALPRFQQIHSGGDVSMVTREFLGALLLRLAPSASLLSVIAVNMPLVQPCPSLYVGFIHRDKTTYIKTGWFLFDI